MEIIICKTAGLCAGASKAYNSVIKSIEDGNKTVVYKEILHNKEIIKSLEEKGARFVEELSDVKNYENVILRAHGEEKWVYDNLEKRNISYVDSICSNVLYIRNLVKEKQSQGYSIIFVTKKKDGKLHDEGLGIVSFLNDYLIVSDIDEAKAIVLDVNKKYFIACQTTFPSQQFLDIVEEIKQKAVISNVEIDYKKTTCNFTAVNNEQSKIIASQSDLAIVIGSSYSSNTKGVYNSVKDICPTLYLNDANTIVNEVKGYIKENSIDIQNFKICLLAGASTHQDFIKNIKNKLEIEIK